MKVSPTSKNSIALLALTSLLTYGIGFVAFANRAEAGLSNIKDILSTSEPGTVAVNTISFSNTTAITSGQTIKITFDPTTDRFDGVQNLAASDVEFTGAALVASCTGGPNEVTMTTSNTAGNESAIFTVCSGQTVAAGNKSIVFSNKISNPTTTGSYIIRIGGTMADSGDTRVAIIEGVNVRAGVNTNFEFTILPVATGTIINGVSTTIASTANSLGFGTLPIGAPVTIGQELHVVSNSMYGFTVAVKEDQNLTSSSGGDIDLFKDGSNLAVPAAWAGPTNNVNDENTFGHMGLTSNDSDLNSGEFNGSKFAGNFQASSSRVIFSHSGPADGAYQDKGKASVAYRIQIGPMQEAGSDYTNNLTYIATPTF